MKTDKKSKSIEFPMETYREVAELAKKEERSFSSEVVFLVKQALLFLKAPQ